MKPWLYVNIKEVHSDQYDSWMDLQCYEYINFSSDMPVHLRPPEMESQMVNKTVRACCEGWGGAHCSEGKDKNKLV